MNIISVAELPWFKLLTSKWFLILTFLSVTTNEKMACPDISGNFRSHKPPRACLLSVRAWFTCGCSVQQRTFETP